MSLARLLNGHALPPALVIGNGINRYESTSTLNSWEDLLKKLARKYFPRIASEIPKGISVTEFYDVMEIKAKSNGPLTTPLQKEFCNLMRNWKAGEHHRAVVDWAKRNDTPILTTNFERVLSDAGGCTLRRTIKGKFTDYYPWESYYSVSEIAEPATEFGIWHINGMQRYRRSVRLGLTHYMGSVERARGWIHKGKERRLFSGRNIENWLGAKTWLHIIITKPLIFIGLALDENEVFLRWLLVERARYFQKFPDRHKEAWYIHTPNELSSGKRFFFEGVGMKPIRVSSYRDIYGLNVWK